MRRTQSRECSVALVRCNRARQGATQRNPNLRTHEARTCRVVVDAKDDATTIRRERGKYAYKQEKRALDAANRGVFHAMGRHSVGVDPV